MNTRPLRHTALVLALLLAFGAGHFSARWPAGPAPAEQAPTTLPAAVTVAAVHMQGGVQAVPRTPADDAADAEGRRILWEYALREQYQRMYNAHTGDYDQAMTVYGGLYTYLDWAGRMAALGSEPQALLAELYRREALRMAEALGGTVFETLTDEVEADTLAQWQGQWQEADLYRRFDIDPLPLAAAWPEQGIKIWGLGKAGASLLEVDGEQVVLPLAIPSIWRSAPQALRADLDGDGREEIAVAACWGWGTGVLAYGLSIVTHTPDAWPFFSTPAVFQNEDFAALIAPHVTLTLEGSDVVASGYGSTVTYSVADWEAPVTEIGVMLDEIASVEITQAGGIRLRVGVGFSSSLHASPCFFAAIEGDLRWDGTSLTLENARLSEW